MTEPRVAIVTGAAQGLGSAICSRLTKDGWIVVGADIQQVPVGGPCRKFVTCDVSDVDQVTALVQGTVARHGRLDAVVNNAGIGGPVDAVVDMDPDDFERVLAVNLIGPFLVSRAAIPHLMASAPGSAIVNFGSLFGQQGVDHGAAYCASKGGVTLLTHSLSRELAPFGIRVNTIAPGNMLTRMHQDEIDYRAIQAGITSAEMEREIRDGVPLGRHGTGDDIAAAVAWLLSSESSYVTGQTLNINGGVFMT